VTPGHSPASTPAATASANRCILTSQLASLNRERLPRGTSVTHDGHRGLDEFTRERYPADVSKGWLDVSIDDSDNPHDERDDNCGYLKRESILVGHVWLLEKVESIVAEKVDEKHRLLADVFGRHVHLYGWESFKEMMEADLGLRGDSLSMSLSLSRCDEPANFISIPLC
jgi:hypothetical protein